MRMNRVAKILVWLVAVFFFAFICLVIYLANTGSNWSMMQWAQSLPWGDKTAHMILYGILAFLVNAALRFRPIRISAVGAFSNFLQIGSLAVITFALAEELSQFWFPKRTPDWWDVAFDFIGIGFATLVAGFLSWIQSLKTAEEDH